MNSGSVLTTNGDNTPAILAQSVGGGGGRITANGYGAYDGFAGGAGIGGDVAVTVAGSVQANGTASPGIFAEVANGTLPSGVIGGVVAVTVSPGATVQGGHNFSAGDGFGAGIYVVGGGTSSTGSYSNTITNQGTITSLDGVNGTAIYGTGGWTNVVNSGTITGNLDLDNGGGGGCTGASCPTVGSTFKNQAGGTLNTGAVVRLGAAGSLTNAGTLNIGGTGRIATTAVAGNLAQTATGRLVVDTDHHAGTADRLDVQGTASLGGLVEVHAANINNRAVTILTATGGLTVDPSLATTRTYLVRFDLQNSGTSVQIRPQAKFATAASGFGISRRSRATYSRCSTPARSWEAGLACWLGSAARKATAPRSAAWPGPRSAASPPPGRRPAIASAAT